MINGRKIFAIVLSVALIMAMSITAFATANADQTDFAVNLPIFSNNKEVGKIAKADNSTDHFTISISSISMEFTKVRAWTEKPVGTNYSDPYEQIGVGDNQEMDYTTTPKKGDQVVLNLDNPVYSTSSPTVIGSWTPN